MEKRTITYLKRSAEIPSRPLDVGGTMRTTALGVLGYKLVSIPGDRILCEIQILQVSYRHCVLLQGVLAATAISGFELRVGSALCVIDYVWYTYLGQILAVMWTNQMQETQNAKKHGDDDFRAINFATAIDGYTLVYGCLRKLRTEDFTGDAVWIRFFPDKAASLALEVICKLLKELKVGPRPVVFASFSDFCGILIN